MSTEIMSLPPAIESNPGDSLPLLSGVKRRKSDGKRLHSSPKRQRTDAGEDASDLQDHAIEETILDPVLDHLVAASVHAIRSCSDQELETFGSQSPDANRKVNRTRSILTTMAMHLEDLDMAESDATEEDRRILRQAYTLRAFNLRHEENMIEVFTSEKQALESRGPWMAPAARMVQACIDGSFPQILRILRAVMDDALEGLEDGASLEEVGDAVEAPDAIASVEEQLRALQGGAQLDVEAFDEEAFDFMALARRAAQDALNREQQHANGEEGSMSALAPSEGPLPRSDAPMPAANGASSTDIPSRPAALPETNATASTISKPKGSSLQEQYELVRMRAANRDYRQQPETTNPPSGRRPWSKIEEDALMRGLDIVGGPHWAQILERFGENGTISHALAGRSQVQLKDKARNLKYAFQKTGQPLPACLEAVTGELKRTGGAKRNDI